MFLHPCGAVWEELFYLRLLSTPAEDPGVHGCMAAALVVGML